MLQHVHVSSTGDLRIHELLSKLLKGGYVEDYLGEYFGAFRGDTRGFDYSSHTFWGPCRHHPAKPITPKY